MILPTPRPNDLGIIYDKNGTGAGNYTDIAGNSQSIVTLTTAYTKQTTTGTVDYSHPFVGSPFALSLSFTVTLSAAATITVKIQGRYDSSAPWADLQSVREDTGAVQAAHALGAGTTYVQTSSSLGVAQIRILAKADGGAPLLGDAVVAQGWLA